MAVAAYRGTTPAIVARRTAGVPARPRSARTARPGARPPGADRRAAGARRSAAPAPDDRPGARAARCSASPAPAWRCSSSEAPMRSSIAALLGPTIALAGGAGAALNTIAGAPDPFSTEMSGAMLPPEVAGITMTLRLLVAAARRHGRRDPRRCWPARPPSAATIRSRPQSAVSIGVLVVVALVAVWVERRPEFRIWWQNLKLDASGKPTMQTIGRRHSVSTPMLLATRAHEGLRRPTGAAPARSAGRAGRADRARSATTARARARSSSWPPACSIRRGARSTSPVRPPGVSGLGR